MRSGIVVECKTCRQAGRCSDRAAMQRESLFAWGRREPAPSCSDYDPRYHHGIEGVFADPSPHPSRRWSVASINHGDRAC